MLISVAARTSPLSQAQVHEVLQELQQHHPEVVLQPHFVETVGDKDQTTSLRTLDKTDFFTREVDTLLLSGQCRIAIHSAKDLPEPLPKGLQLVALTRGVDASDALVLRPGETLASLPPHAKIATSSERREETVRSLRADLHFVDIRGTISQRLKKLDVKEVDGVVIAEAALIRLGMTDRNRVRLPGPTAPFQGQLALLSRRNDIEMEDLFACLDTRQSLYLGIDLPKNRSNVFHYPIIQTVSHPSPNIQEAFSELHAYTHLLFTSKNGVRFFKDALHTYGYQYRHIQNKYTIAVGQATAALMKELGWHVSLIAQEETSEGIIKELSAHDLRHAYLFWPHSAKSRTVLIHFFHRNQIRYRDCILYDTIPNDPGPLPPLLAFKEMVFTSPSTVEAFLQRFGRPKYPIKCITIGPITYEAAQRASLTASCETAG